MGAKGPVEGDKEVFLASDEAKPAELSDEKKADQKTVDSALMKEIESVDLLKDYLHARFSLTKNDRPHKMKFKTQITFVWIVLHITNNASTFLSIQVKSN